MKIIFLTGRFMTRNGGGVEVTDALTDGRMRWPIDVAARAIIAGHLIFMYQGERLIDLNKLPRVQDSP